jgi:hypothetical protein
MSDAAHKPDKPDDPPYGGGEDEQPKHQDQQEVKEPPRPGTAGREERSPRNGEV